MKEVYNGACTLPEQSLALEVTFRGYYKLAP